MGKMFTKFKTEMVFRSIAMIIAGIVLLLFPEATQNTIAYVISIILVICGILKIISYFRRAPGKVGELNEYASPMDLVVGILFIVLAALVAKVLLSIIPIVLGLVVLVSGLIKLEQAVELIRAKQGNWVGIMVLAVVTVIVGLLAICNPFKTGSVLLRVIGIGLAFGGITDLIATGYVSGKLKDSE